MLGEFKSNIYPHLLIQRSVKVSIVKMKVLVAQLCLTLVTSWTAAHQAPLPMRFSRQGYWSGLPFPSAGNHPDPGNEPRTPALQADSLPTQLQSSLLSLLNSASLYSMKPDIDTV